MFDLIKKKLLSRFRERKKNPGETLIKLGKNGYYLRDKEKNKGRRKKKNHLQN